MAEQLTLFNFTDTRVCTVCGAEKDIREFYRNRKYRLRKCKPCAREISRGLCAKWRQENPEKAKERGRAASRLARQRNPEAVRARARRWCRKHRERLCAERREWRIENPELARERDRRNRENRREAIKAENRRWELRNPGAVRAKSRRNTRKRRARKAGADGQCSPGQLAARFAYYGNRCMYCGGAESLQDEHIIPLAGGGPDWPANHAPACSGCNVSKGAKTMEQWLDTGGGYVGVPGPLGCLP